MKNKLSPYVWVWFEGFSGGRFAAGCVIRFNSAGGKLPIGLRNRLGDLAGPLEPVLSGISSILWTFSP